MKRFPAANIVLGIFAMGFLAQSAFADAPSPFVGRWHWNHGQSTLPPGEPAPTDLTTEISRSDNQHLSWSVTIATEDGQNHVETFDAATNGEFQTVGDATAAFRLNGDALQATFKGPTNQLDAFTCRVSDDARKMTCKGTVDQGDGKPAPYVDVYDRM
jgi:hypothetical protein